MKIIVTESQIKRLNHTIIEQIDTDDEERELMNTWYGDGDEDEYDFDSQYQPDYDIDSDDSYELSRDKYSNERMNRSVRVGGAGAVDKETNEYVIDGKRYMLTPIEYRQKLRSMGRTTPEKAIQMGVTVGTSGKILDDGVAMERIKYLQKRIKTIQSDIEKYEDFVNRGYGDERLKWKIKYLYASLDTAMNDYDELVGNVNGEEYDF